MNKSFFIAGGFPELLVDSGTTEIPSVTVKFNNARTVAVPIVSEGSSLIAARSCFPLVLFLTKFQGHRGNSHYYERILLGMDTLHDLMKHWFRHVHPSQASIVMASQDFRYAVLPPEKMERVFEGFQMGRFDKALNSDLLYALSIKEALSEAAEVPLVSVPSTPAALQACLTMFDSDSPVERVAVNRTFYSHYVHLKTDQQ